MKNNHFTLCPSKDLCFDSDNPRLYEKALLLENDPSPRSSEDKIIKFLYEEMDVQELILSMAASGFFPHEPLMVDSSDGERVVIEGNRRLAATRLLLHPAKSDELNLKAKIPDIPDNIKKTLIEVPVIFEKREELWKFLGFKHVNGPARWGSYAKSKYVADVHFKYGIELHEIARQIGDTHKTVQRLFRGLMVIKQAENNDIFNREDIVKKHFAFSHLYVGITYPNICKFLGLRPEIEESKTPVPETHMQELGEFCLWLYGSKKRNIEPVIQSQNPDLRRLEETLGNTEALISLRKGDPLVVAHELRLSPANVFSTSLIDAKQNLQKARAMLTDGYQGSEDLLRTAGSIANLADDLYREMERVRINDSKTRLVEEN